MKRTKRIVSLLLTFVLLWGLLPPDQVSIVHAATSTDGYSYTVSSDGYATIKGYSGSDSVLSIPSTLDGFPVSTIGFDAFAGKTKLKQVSIPDGITGIEGQAFKGCTALKSIYIPGSVKSFGNDVFNGCSSLTAISIPEGVSGIGMGMFSDCSSLVSVTIPASVKSIGYYAFYNCRALTSIDLHNVISIGLSAFEYCTSLKSLRIPEGVATLSSYVFRGCSALESVTLPYGLRSIGTWAFSGCSSLKEVYFPSTVTQINECAFYNCASLTSIKIPSAVTTMGKDVFSGCTKLETIYCEAESQPSNWDSHWKGFYHDVQMFWNTCLHWEISANTVAPTCTEDGYTSKTCTACGIEISRESLPASGHDYNAVVTKPACTSDGYTTYTCHCGVGYVADYIDAIGHSFGDWYIVTEATCTETGEERRVCTHCEHYETQTILAVGHQFDNACDATCNSCKYTRAITHTYTAPTYDVTKHWVECVSCGDIKDRADHQYESVCDIDCDGCGYVREDAHVYDTAHVFDHIQHWRECTVCNEKLYVEKHLFGDETDVTCNICQFVRKIATVVYDANEGIGAPTVLYTEAGCEIALSTQIPSRSGYIFAGWAIVPDGDPVYQAGDTITLTESLTLHAVWKAQCKSCQGSGQTILKKDCTSCRGGYFWAANCIFCHGKGKYSNGNMSCSYCYGSGRVPDPYGSGKQVVCLICNGDGLVPDYETCYYCRTTCADCKGSTTITEWVPCDNCDGMGCFDIYHIYYEANGGTNAPATQETHGNNTTLSKQIPKKDGFVFAGWYAFNAQNTTYQPGDTYCGGNVTLYAIWMPNCQSCSGAGYLLESKTCGKCGGDGRYTETTRKCLSCGSTNISVAITGYGELVICRSCLSLDVSTSTTTHSCTQCDDGVVTSRCPCEECGGKGYLDSPAARRDVDRNGIVEEADVTLLTSVLVGNTETDVVFDFDYDGELTIYDCVLLMQQID